MTQSKDLRLLSLLPLPVLLHPTPKRIVIVSCHPDLLLSLFSLASNNKTGAPSIAYFAMGGM
jgi:hypothetical protein